MRRFFSGALALISLVLLVTLPVVAERRMVTDGLFYEHLERDGPVSIHLLEVDVHSLEIVAERALNDGIGRETVSSMVRRKGAQAGINGGFFSKGGLYDGDPVGVLRTARGWFSDSRLTRGVVGWHDGGRVALIDWISAQWEVRTGSKRIPVAGINRQRRDRDIVLYTWAFHRSTLTPSGGTEILIDDGVVQEIRQGGDSWIPPDGFVLSIGPSAASNPAEGLTTGVPAQPAFIVQAERTKEADWKEMEYMVGGGPVLVLDSKPIADFSRESESDTFLNNRHPRTAVGIREDGKWIFVVVDGRQDQLSVGMSMAELAALMQSLACRSALNLDGGGSSTLVVGGRVANSPSDLGIERPVSDAILIRPRPGIR